MSNGHHRRIDGRVFPAGAINVAARRRYRADDCAHRCGDTTAFFGMKAEQQSADQRIAKIENTLQQLANVVVLAARQDEKINSN